MPVTTEKRSGVHSPTLESIRMVEDFIREDSGEFKYSGEVHGRDWTYI